jgi:hypothetical protein
MESGLLLGGWIVRGDKHFQKKEPPPGEKKISVGMVGGVNRGVVGSSSSFTFRERVTLVYVPLEKLTTQVSIRFLEKTAFDFALLVVKVPTSSCSAHDLILESAKHSKVNDVTTKISGKDGVTEELYPDESIRLTYNAVPLGYDKVRSFILVANGRYERIEGDQLTRVPVEFQLEKNYPNPFNPQTTIRYQLAKPGNVQVVIYNQLGQEVIKLVDTYQEVGYYEKTWDASDAPSGIYYIRMSVADQFGKQLYQATHKLVVMK